MWCCVVHLSAPTTLKTTWMSIIYHDYIYIYMQSGCVHFQFTDVSRVPSFDWPHAQSKLWMQYGHPSQHRPWLKRLSQQIELPTDWAQFAANIPSLNMNRGNGTRSDDRLTLSSLLTSGATWLCWIQSINSWLVSQSSGLVSLWYRETSRAPWFSNTNHVSERIDTPSNVLSRC